MIPAKECTYNSNEQLFLGELCLEELQSERSNSIIETEEDTIFNEIRTQIDNQNDKIKKLFYSFKENEIRDGIKGRSELLKITENHLLFLRKSKKGKIQVLIDKQIFSGISKRVWKMQNILDHDVYALTLKATQKEVNICKKIRKAVGCQIVKIHSVARQSYSGAVLMEFCGGGTFGEFKKEMLKTGSFSKYLTQVEAIGQLLLKVFRAGFVHGDLHDNNVMFTDEGAIRLIDFGKAKEIREDIDFDGSLWKDNVNYSCYLLEPCFDFIEKEKKQVSNNIIPLEDIELLIKNAQMQIEESSDPISRMEKALSLINEAIALLNPM